MSTLVQTPPATGGAPAAPSAPEAKKKPDPHYIALRNFALSISVFNIFGYTLLGFEQPWLWPLLALAVGYSTELSFETLSAWAYRRRPRYLGKGARGMYEFLLPAHITSIAVNMLLYANNQFLPVALGVVIGVSAKHAMRAPIGGKMRHFMNPSNFGIAAVLLLLGNWVSIAPPYEFTEKANTFFRVMIPIVIVTAGTVINGLLTKRVPLIVGWLGGFAIQAFIRHGIWNVALFSALGPMTGVAFVLYTNYMVTDPGTTPSKARPQFMFGASVAMVYGVLMLFQVVYTLFFATAIVCILRGGGWWVAYYFGERRKRAAAAVPPAGRSVAAEAVSA
ncbi:MAG TPA: enediyne biosynthesis protein [Actinocrinis sp.]|jgi:hypothetical protein